MGQSNAARIEEYDEQPAAEQPTEPRLRYQIAPHAVRGGMSRHFRTRRELTDWIFGKPGTKELQEFAFEMREQFMDGTINPAIATTLLHWWCGKPKDTIEIQESGPSVEEMSNEDLQLRALYLAQQAMTLQGEVVRREIQAGESEARVIEIASERMSDTPNDSTCTKPHTSPPTDLIAKK